MLSETMLFATVAVTVIPGASAQLHSPQGASLPHKPPLCRHSVHLPAHSLPSGLVGHHPPDFNQL